MTLDSKKEFLTTKELAERWRVTEKSVLKWRKEGKAPPFYTIHGSILYRLADVEELEEAKRKSTKT
ncbi:MAG TPA: terminase [Balneola sp.]|nr:terminase [Balneola sp.]|tara:strand:- start:516 stop:713 length:198 start_codon:yes stop_codon:yes gene_type:complete